MSVGEVLCHVIMRIHHGIVRLRHALFCLCYADEMSVGEMFCQWDVYRRSVMLTRCVSVRCCTMLLHASITSVVRARYVPTWDKGHSGTIYHHHPAVKPPRTGGISAVRATGRIWWGMIWMEEFWERKNNLKDISPFLWGHWYPSFGLLVTSALGFKVKGRGPAFSNFITDTLQKEHSILTGPVI